MSFRWLIAPGARPRPGAREALEEAAGRRPDALIVTSRVVGGREPWPELFDRDRAIDAARDRLLAVRAVAAGSLLVRDDVLGEPHGADLTWSARILSAGGGYLAPDSIVDWPDAPTGSRADHWRLVRLPGLSASERLWQAYLTLSRA